MISGGDRIRVWDQRFSDPIILPGRKRFVTLRDAAKYIVKLPKAEQQAVEWQAAAEVLNRRAWRRSDDGAHRDDASAAKR
jgi:hypothetical protein